MSTTSSSHSRAKGDKMRHQHFRSPVNVEQPRSKARPVAAPWTLNVGRVFIRMTIDTCCADYNHGALTKRVRRALVTGTLAALFAAAALAQSALTQLGLTDASAAAFVMNEIKAPAHGRQSPIAVAGTRAFLKLPRSARADAATGLFAWARAHVNSPAFKASYAIYRNGLMPTERLYALTVQQEVKKEIDQQLSLMESLGQAAEKMPPAQRAAMLEQVKTARAQFTNPEYIKQLEAAKTAERARESQSRVDSAAEIEKKTPADPNVLIARRLREFLEATANVNFEARTISLTLGSDGIEFLDRPDRAKHWMWQQAVIVGPEATAAARTAAAAWLKEIER
jgi:hypothetical protein